MSRSMSIRLRSSHAMKTSSVLQQQDTDFYASEKDKLITHCDKCLYHQGHYVGRLSICYTLRAHCHFLPIEPYFSNVIIVNIFTDWSTCIIIELQKAKLSKLGEHMHEKCWSANNLAFSFCMRIMPQVPLTTSKTIIGLSCHPVICRVKGEIYTDLLGKMLSYLLFC